MELFRMENATGLPCISVNIYLFCLLIAASGIDLKCQKIPNFLTFPSMIIGILGASLYAGMPGLYFSLAGTAVGFFLLLIPYAAGGMGAGDVKLMMAVGSFLGPKGIFVAFLFTALVGGMYALLFILSRPAILKFYLSKLGFLILKVFRMSHHMVPPVIEDKGKPKLCYGVAITLGTFIYIGFTVSGYEFTLLL